MAHRPRLSNPCYKVRECATWLGVSPHWVRKAIRAGVNTGGCDISAAVGRRWVRLEAESITVNGRHMYRIHEDAFVTFLRAIGSKRLPAGSSPSGLASVPPLLEVEQCAYRLRISAESVRRLIRQKQLTGIRLTRRWQVHPRDLDAFINARRAECDNGQPMNAGTRAAGDNR